MRKRRLPTRKRAENSTLANITCVTFCGPSPWGTWWTVVWHRSKRAEEPDRVRSFGSRGRKGELENPRMHSLGTKVT